MIGNSDFISISRNSYRWSGFAHSVFLNDVADHESKQKHVEVDSTKHENCIKSEFYMLQQIWKWVSIFPDHR